MFGCHADRNGARGRVLRVLREVKHPVNIMVLGVIISDNDFILPFIFTHGTRLNMNAIKCLEWTVLPSMKRVAEGRHVR